MDVGEQLRRLLRTIEGKREMSITSYGWFTWATRDANYPSGVNGGMNPVRGVVLHSVEGNFQSLQHLHDFHLGRITAPPNQRASWMATNLKDGRFVQHFPIYAQTWTSGADYPNDNFAAWENEGKAGEPLTVAQNNNNIRAIREIVALKQWTPRRPTSPIDKGATFWEHNEMVRWGAAATACPSNRIPWALYLAALKEDDMAAPYFAWADNRLWFVGPGGTAHWVTTKEAADKIAQIYGLPNGNATVALSKEAIAGLGGR